MKPLFNKYFICSVTSPVLCPNFLPATCFETLSVLMFDNFSLEMQVLRGTEVEMKMAPCSLFEVDGRFRDAF
jgi:hypothetical protein